VHPRRRLPPLKGAFGRIASGTFQKQLYSFTSATPTYRSKKHTSHNRSILPKIVSNSLLGNGFFLLAGAAERPCSTMNRTTAKKLSISPCEPASRSFFQKAPQDFLSTLMGN